MARRVVAVVQARFGSSRLPGKALRILNGRPVLAHVLERARQIPGLADVVLATTNACTDDLLAAEAMKLGVMSLRGSEWDVLERVAMAAHVTRADVVVRLTGDCPLLAPEVGAAVLALFEAVPEAAYAWNDTLRSGFPDGTDIEVVRRDWLDEARQRATRAPDREHVTSWVRDHAEVLTLNSATDWSWLKLSVDCAADLARVRAISRHLPEGYYSLSDTLAAAEAAGFVKGGD